MTTRDPATLYAMSIAIGSTCRGALMIVGDAWPRDVPVWTCPHRHAAAADAQACADEELVRRRETVEPK